MSAPLAPGDFFRSRMGQNQRVHIVAVSGPNDPPDVTRSVCGHFFGYVEPAHGDDPRQCIACEQGDGQ